MQRARRRSAHRRAPAPNAGRIDVSQRLLAIVAVASLALVPAGVLGAQEGSTEGGPRHEGAAPREGDGLRILVRAGATAAVLRGALAVDAGEPSSFDVGYGFAGALAVDLPIAERLSLQPEVMIVRRRTRLDLADAGERSHLSASYVELPLMLKWYPRGKPDVRVHLDAGPVLALHTSASRDVRQGDTTIVSAPADDLLEDVEWALAAGVGFEFPELFAHFTVDVRYRHGLTRANVSEGPPDARWSGVLALIGMAF